MENILLAIKVAWQMAPFPFLFLAIIVAGFVWLWVEFQATRFLRATPGWHRPAPLMPEISLVSVGLIRVLWILLWLWLVLFIALAVTVGLSQGSADVPASAVDGALGAGRVWNQGYRVLADRLPDQAPAWLRPAPAEPADLRLLLGRSSSDRSAAALAAAAPSDSLVATVPVPTPTSSPTALPVVTVKIVRNANVRRGPSTTAASLGVARVDRIYPVTGRNADSTWLRIDFAGEEGWVFSELVAVEGDLAAVAVAPR